MKNPLNKRMLRELRSEMGKYAVIAILLIATIGFVSDAVKPIERMLELS